ncbi:hypothetical protein DQ240_12655 [Blastococcus sp. TF02A-26]|nr:hypothetical protein DQ240_12655 [Blastococcus sp. TF02A-26]
MASMLLSVTSHPDGSPEHTPEFIRRLLAWNCVESSAGALAMATLAGHADLRRRVRRDLADRGHFVPRWLADLHRSTSVARAVEVSGPFRDLDDLVLGVTTPTGHPLTAVVRVDNEIRSRDVGGALFEHPLDTVVDGMTRPGDPDVHVRDISPADVRARLEAALSGPDVDALIGKSTDWSSQRPILRWMLALLTAGGDATVPGSMDDVDLDAVAAEFLASPWGRPWTRRGLPLLLEEILADGLGNGIGDPLLWAPHHVRRLLGVEPAEALLDHLDAGRTPELLRDLIRYGHAERGLRPELIDRSLAAVDRHADSFLDAVRAWQSDAG